MKGPCNEKLCIGEWPEDATIAIEMQSAVGAAVHTRHHAIPLVHNTHTRMNASLFCARRHRTHPPAVINSDTISIGMHALNEAGCCIIVETRKDSNNLHWQYYLALRHPHSSITSVNCVPRLHNIYLKSCS